MIKISLVDDELLFLNGLKEILTAQKGFRILNTYNNHKTLLNDWKSGGEKPDILFADIKMPEISGIELTKIVLEQTPEVKVIGLSSHYSKVFIFKMLQMGAAAYLPKNVNVERLVRTIKYVHTQGFYFEDITLKAFHENKLSSKVKKDILNHGLTDRELNILLLICEQLTNHEIAERLFISLKTIERHRSNLFEKTNAKNVVGLVLFALNHQLIDHSYV